MRRQKILMTLSILDVTRLSISARTLRILERRFNQRISNELHKHVQRISETIFHRGDIFTLDFDVSDVLLEHAFEVIQATLKEVHDNTPKNFIKLGDAPAMRMPSTLKDLMAWYDASRRKKPPRIKALANRIKQAYLKKCHKVYVEYSEKFRTGQTFGQAEVEKEVQEAADTTHSRAKMIVATETTNYYNKTLVNFYDRSPDVTHYLFLSISDKRTTPWCRDRDGLVYAKDNVLTAKERPPVHWNCRSQMLPLSPYNPRHRTLIDDKSLRRENNACEPLPPEWR